MTCHVKSVSKPIMGLPFRDGPSVTAVARGFDETGIGRGLNPAVALK